MNFEPVKIRRNAKPHSARLANLTSVREDCPASIDQFTYGSPQISPRDLHIDRLFEITQTTAEANLTQFFPARTFEVTISNDAAIAFSLHNRPACTAAGNRSAKIIEDDFCTERIVTPAIHRRRRNPQDR